MHYLKISCINNHINGTTDHFAQNFDTLLKFDLNFFKLYKLGEFLKIGHL